MAKKSDLSINYRSFLQEAFNKRQKKNGSYSLRAFARDLEIPASRLSEVLNGKKGISEDRADKLAGKLSLDKTEKEFFLDLVRSEHARSSTVKKIARQRIEFRLGRLKSLSKDQFNLISDWHHFSLLELLLIETDHSLEYLAQRLGITRNETQKSLELMSRLDLIVQQNGRWLRTDQGLTTTVDISSDAIQIYNRQILKKAEKALTERSIHERDFSSVVFAVNKENLEIAKARLSQFRRELMVELETKPNPNAIYCLALQFFEITEPK